MHVIRHDYEGMKRVQLPDGFPIMQGIYHGCDPRIPEPIRANCSFIDLTIWGQKAPSRIVFGSEKVRSNPLQCARQTPRYEDRNTIRHPMRQPWQMLSKQC